MLKNAPRIVTSAALFAVICIAALLGAFEARDLALMDMRFRLLERAPSDTLVIVEIDPYSLKEEQRWPWSRDRYATAVANLQDAGAALIAFDVDFSSLSEKSGDAAFAAYLAARPGEVILPVFSQWSSRAGSEPVIVQTPPHTYFLNDAVIASVNLTAEDNGFVRRGWRGFGEGVERRSTLAATLAGASAAHTEAFYIDYGIDPSKIQRLSFNDVLKNGFPKEIVAGKNILIGATALELGDEFVAPVHGVVPGVDLHALSYESLHQNRALKRPNAAIPLLLALFIILYFCGVTGNARTRATAILHIAVFTASIGAPIILQALAPISFDVAPIIAAQILCIIYATACELHERAMHLLRHRRTTARFQALTGLVVSNNSDGVIVATADGVIELCNDRAKALLGYKTGLPANAAIADLAPGFPLYKSVECIDADGLASAASALPQYSEYYVAGPRDGVLEIVAARASYDDRGSADAAQATMSHVFVYTLRDISARKQREADEKAAKEAALAASALKSQIISNMSHELRTPLNGVIGFADIMNKESFGPLGVPEYKEFSQSIYISGKRLLCVVNDMLNIAKLEAGDIELSKDAAPLSEVIEQILNAEETLFSIGEKSIEIEMPADFPPLKIDFVIFREMIAHLISNAIKFTGDYGRITIRAELHGTDLMIEVEDNGCGVDPSSLAKLTNAFYQADGALDRKHDGAGLGLYLVSKFAELHEGTLELESDEGAGFTARLQFKNIKPYKQRQAA